MKKTAFTALFLLVMVMGAATFVEKQQGADWVARYVYGSWWFALLWGIVAVCGMAFFLRSRKAAHNLLLHSSLVLILAGALLTSLTARRGTVHLRQGETVSAFLSETGAEEPLPFRLTLKDFSIDYHAGTETPSDYCSVIAIETNGNIETGEVSMNRIYNYHGTRLYQMSYDSDMQGASLNVNEDKWGLPLTYAGYMLLFVSFVWMLLAPKGGFRKLLRDPRLRKGLAVIGLLLAGGLGCRAAEALPKAQAQAFGEMLIEYNGRVCPLQTVAIDFTKKLSGKGSYKSYTAEQVLTGFLFYSGSWNKEPIIKVKSRVLREAIDVGKQASVSDFFSGSYKLGPYVDAYYRGERNALNKAAADIDDRLMLIMTLQRGEWLKMFPVKEAESIRWYSPVEKLPVAADSTQTLFIRNAFNLLYENSVQQGNETEFLENVGQMKKYQLKYGGNSVPGERALAAEQLYNRIPFADILYKVNLTVGLLLVVLLIRRLLAEGGSRRGWEKRVNTCGKILLVCSFAVLTAGIVLRCVVSGRLPLGNGYETMLSLAWCVLLIALLALKRASYLLSFGFLLSGFFLLVSSISQMDPQITPLVPVLSSPLLTVHVSLIMMAYAMLSFTFLCAVIALVIVLAKGTRSPEAQEKVQTLQVISRLFLYPALALLGMGIFIGAVWANQSWGRYWGWDPKETWALVNFVLYGIAIHSGSLSWLRRPVAYHVYMFVAFLTVLMTYIGVNYFLGGMHSYA